MHSVTTDELTVLASETHRLTALLQQDRPSPAGLKYALRKLTRTLANLGVTYVDLTDQKYDPGLSVDVVDQVGEGEEYRIREMTTPIILHGGELLARGQVVLEALPKPAPTEPPWAKLIRMRRRRKRRRRPARSPELVARSAGRKDDGEIFRAGDGGTEIPDIRSQIADKR